VRKMYVIYDSLTGNTELMAKAIADGAKSIKDVEVVLRKLDESFSPEELVDASAVVLGSPTIYGDVSDRMKSLLEAIKKIRLGGKIGAAFGSYQWSGEAPSILSEAMKSLGMNIIGPELLVELTPKGSDLKKCGEFGEAIARKLTKI
jgi:flavodoxin I